MFAPASLTADLLNDAGPVGTAILALFMCAILLGVIDLLVNDLMPDRFVLATLHKLRPFGMLVLAATYAFLAAASSFDDGMTRGGTILVTGYVLAASGCVWWSLSYAYQRMQRASSS